MSGRGLDRSSGPVPSLSATQVPSFASVPAAVDPDQERILNQKALVAIAEDGFDSRSERGSQLTITEALEAIKTISLQTPGHTASFLLVFHGNVTFDITGGEGPALPAGYPSAVMIGSRVSEPGIFMQVLDETGARAGQPVNLGEVLNSQPAISPNEETLRLSLQPLDGRNQFELTISNPFGVALIGYPPFQDRSEQDRTVFKHIAAAVGLSLEAILPEKLGDPKESPSFLATDSSSGAKFILGRLSKASTTGAIVGEGYSIDTVHPDPKSPGKLVLASHFRMPWGSGAAVIDCLRNLLPVGLNQSGPAVGEPDHGSLTNMSGPRSSLKAGPELPAKIHSIIDSAKSRCLCIASLPSSVGLFGKKSTAGGFGAYSPEVVLPPLKEQLIEALFSLDEDITDHQLLIAIREVPRAGSDQALLLFNYIDLHEDPGQDMRGRRVRLALQLPKVDAQSIAEFLATQPSAFQSVLDTLAAPLGERAREIDFKIQEVVHDPGSKRK